MRNKNLVKSGLLLQIAEILYQCKKKSVDICQAILHKLELLYRGSAALAAVTIPATSAILLWGFFL